MGQDGEVKLELIAERNAAIDRAKQIEAEFSAFKALNDTERCAVIAIISEYLTATQRYGPFASHHEGYAIIKEEVDELWDEIKKKPSLRNNTLLTRESIQIAAMGLRFLVDTCLDKK